MVRRDRQSRYEESGISFILLALIFEQLMGQQNFLLWISRVYSALGIFIENSLSIFDVAGYFVKKIDQNAYRCKLTNIERHKLTG